jgi:predicted TIM-barrel fold metal-dependent hydrolase
MYPLFGICAKLHVPVVLDFSTRERWLYHRPQVEVVAADFPQLDILLATPPRTDAASIFLMLQRLSRVSFLLTPQEMQDVPSLCESLELHGRERILFRSYPLNWCAAVEMARALPMSVGAKRSYLYENAARLFHFDLDEA